MSTNSRSPNRLEKQSISTSFNWEIASALLVKFVLLGTLWWLFFAGHKQVVDDTRITQQILGHQASNIEQTRLGE